jgi:hypothetical protein
MRSRRRRLRSISFAPAAIASRMGLAVRRWSGGSDTARVAHIDAARVFARTSAPLPNFEFSRTRRVDNKDKIASNSESCPNDVRPPSRAKKVM